MKRNLGRRPILTCWSSYLSLWFLFSFFLSYQYSLWTLARCQFVSTMFVLYNWLIKSRKLMEHQIPPFEFHNNTPKNEKQLKKHTRYWWVLGWKLQKRMQIICQISREKARMPPLHSSVQTRSSKASWKNIGHRDCNPNKKNSKNWVNYI